MDFNEDLNATLPTVIKRTKKKKKILWLSYFQVFVSDLEVENQCQMSKKSAIHKSKAVHHPENNVK